MDGMTEAMYYLLLAIRTPSHGYRLMEQITKISHGRVSIGPGTLYGLLHKLENYGFIIQDNVDGRRKVYRMTPAGESALRTEYGRLQAMVLDGISIKKPPHKMNYFP